MTPHSFLQTVSQPGKRAVLIDTCIIQHAGSSESTKRQVVTEYLNKLSQSYSLVISHITTFENLRGLWGKHFEVAASALGKFAQKSLSPAVLSLAAAYGGLCSKEQLQIPSEGDLLISATAILENGLVFTENRKDFPAPFFDTLQWVPLVYKNKGRYEKTLDLYLCEPNSILIARKMRELNKTHR